jgi:hypothetical protein
MSVARREQEAGHRGDRFPTHDDLTDRLIVAMQRLIANSVLRNEQIARAVRLNVVDLQTLGVISQLGADDTRRGVESDAAVPERLAELTPHHEPIVAGLRTIHTDYSADELAIVTRYLEALSEV